MNFKNFRHRGVQNIIIGMIIFLATVLINGAASILLAVDKPVEDLEKECKAAEGILVLNTTNSEEIDGIVSDLEQQDNVKKVVCVNEYSLTEKVTAKNKNITEYLRLSEYNEGVHKAVRVIEGNVDGDNYTENQCAISACVANKQGLSVGDKLTISFQQGKKEYEIAGIYANPYNVSRGFSQEVIVKKIPENLKTGKRVYIYAQNHATLKEIEEEYRINHDGNMNGETMEQKDYVNQQLLSTHILGGIFLGIGVIVLLVSVLVIYFIMKNMLLSDAKKIAIYKTIGYSYQDILYMYLGFYTVVIGISAFLGIVFSQILSANVLKSVYQDMGQKTEYNFFYPGWICFVGILVLVLGIIYGIMSQARNIKPVYAFNDMSSLNTKKRKQKGNMKMMFSPFGIAIRNITRDKKGAIGVILTCMATIYIINFAVISLDVAYNMENTNDYWFAIPPCEVMVNVRGAEQLEEVLDGIKSDTEVEKCAPWNIEKRVFIPWKKGISDTIMFGSVFEDCDEMKLSLIEGRNPKNENEIALSSLMADNLGKKTGDYVTVSLDGKNNEELLITGTYQTYYDMGKTCRLLTSAYTTRNLDTELNSIAIFLKKGVDRNQYIDKLKGRLDSTVKVIKREKCCESIMDIIATPQKKAIPPVSVLIIVIGAVNIFSIIILRNQKNKKMNQIYKSIGYSTRELVLSNICYVSIIGVLSIVVAVPMLCLTYEKIMTISLSIFGTKQYPTNFNWPYLIVANISVLVCFVISTVLSSKSLKKINVRDLVID